MARRLATPLTAYVIAAVALPLLAATVPLAHIAKTSDQGFLVGLVSFLVVGLILVRQRPQNPIGWTMLVSALLGGTTGVAGSYEVAAYNLHYHLPLPQIAVFLQPMWAPAILLFALAVMLFPDGELPSGRGRWLMWTVALIGGTWMIGAFAIAAEAIALGHVAVSESGDLKQIEHPTGGWAWWDIVQKVWFMVMLCAGLIWLVSRVPAYRRATGERRQQLKWLMFGGSTAVVGVVLGVVESGQPGVLGTIANLAILGLLGIPLAIGIGITKYRLYDIDRIISRTLAYALLTALLVGVFVGVVLLTTRVLPFSSPVGVAASTLLAAALFTPLRNRLQRVVDRRFNRAHYDAEATVAAFGARLRDAVDPETVLSELASAAGASLQPAHVSVWVKTS
jgi:hypothetical protein